MPTRLWFCCFVGLMFAGCGAQAPAPVPPPATPAARQATVLDDQLQAMERARAVEATLQAGKDRTDDAMEATEKN